jgi:hypothetical protein
MKQTVYKIQNNKNKGAMLYLLCAFFISLILTSCSSSGSLSRKDMSNYDEVYNSPAEDSKNEDIKIVDSRPESEPIIKQETEPTTISAEEPVYKKYKEGEPETIVRDDNSITPNSSQNNNNSFSNNDDNYYYDDEDDFTYGNSFRRLRYGDGYSDGYRDATYNNYATGGGYYNTFYSDPYWSWYRPQRTQFWVGYNYWNGWNVGYSYSYPRWGWRTGYYPVYNSFCNPWYGYPNAWGYYSNCYFGAPYGYYDPYFGGYYNQFHGGYGNYYNPWQRSVYVYSNNNGGSVGGNNNGSKGKMYGPRETIGTNTSSNNRRDQVSPRSRGGLIQQNPDNGGVVYDPKNDNRAGLVSNGNSNTIKENRGRVGENETNGNTNTGQSRGSVTENNGQITPDNNQGGTTGNSNNTGRKTRIIDRTSPDYGTENSGRVNENNNVGNGKSTNGNSNTRSRGTTENENRSYEPPANSGTTYEQPKNNTRSRGRSYEPSENSQKRYEGNSNPTPQRHEEPRSNHSPRSYDSGGGNRGSSSTPSGGNSGGSSNPSPRGRGR